MKKIKLILFIFLCCLSNMLMVSATSTTPHRSHGLTEDTTTVVVNNSQLDTESIPDDGSYGVTVYNNDFSSNCIDFSPAIRVVGILLLILKIVIPLIIIVTTSINMYNVVTSGNSSDFSKVAKKGAISIVGAILIFFSPVIIDLVMGAVTRIANKPSEYDDTKACRTCISYPTSEECSNFIKLSKEGSYGETVLITPTSSQSTTPSTSTVTHGGGGGGGGNNSFYSPHRSNKLKPSQAGAGLWIAHQKNSINKINAAVKNGFYGIEVDVAYVDGEFILHHANTTDNGAKLIDFLKIAKENNILAVLDLKTIKSKYSELVSTVKRYYSMDSVVFMAMEKYKLEGIYNVDSSARLWYINGFSTDAPYNYFHKDEMTDDFVEKLEGVAVLALLVDKDLVEWVHNRGLYIEAFSYLDYMYDNISVTNLRFWGVDFVSANEIDED